MTKFGWRTFNGGCLFPLGLILFLSGLILLLENLDLIPYGIGELWPVLLILLGIWIMFALWRGR